MKLPIKTIGVSMCLWAASAMECNAQEARVVCDIVDLSGSISQCQSIFSSNLAKVNEGIERLNKNDRYLLYAFRSQATPVKLIDFLFPRKNGGGGTGTKIVAARKALRQLLAERFSQISTNQVSSFSPAGDGTDVLGAIKYLQVIASDIPPDMPMTVNLYSDGLMTQGVSSFKGGKATNYLASLKKTLDGQTLDHLSAQALNWYGGICPSLLEDASITQATEFKLDLKYVWQDYLRQQGINANYLLDY